MSTSICQALDPSLEIRNLHPFQPYKRISPPTPTPKRARLTRVQPPHLVLSPKSPLAPTSLRLRRIVRVSRLPLGPTRPEHAARGDAVDDSLCAVGVDVVCEPLLACIVGLFALALLRRRRRRGLREALPPYTR